MTNQEALLGVLDSIPFSDHAIGKALADQSLTGTETYTKEQSKAVDLAAVELLYVAYTQVDVQEGGYGLSHPDFLRKVQARLLYLATRHQLTDILQILNPKPTVRGVSPW
ncbi:hypothetical protein Q4E40_02600 [Pontibacter sp. BT731]|uniref:DUF6706 family protein n=1 Tax=Pontibacter coccineus TaxID=3063328 RepID=UPI0026E3B7CA|nr:DUF6706 family protein [Pontibacter sp. BT731]MDO6389002.1 hypothetical protein [Pontibacter sp. BT731]